MKKKTRYYIYASTAILLVLLAVFFIRHFRTVKVLYGNTFPEKEVLKSVEEWKDGTRYEHISYADVSESDYLNLYVPESERPLPLFIMVHGGGFFLDDLESRPAMLFCQNIYAQGYAVATVNYRLGSEAKYPAAIEDVKAAIRFLRANARKYGVDPSRFAVAGESAGGYLACMAAVTTDDEFADVKFVDEDKEKKAVPAQVQAVVDFYGATDFDAFEEEFKELGVPEEVRHMANGWMNDILKGTGMETLEEVWIGKRMDEMSEEQKDSYRVSHYVQKNILPSTTLKTVVLHGDADITVPYLQSVNFAQLMTEKLGENMVSCRIFPGYGHGADGFYSQDTIRWITEQIGW